MTEKQQPLTTNEENDIIEMVDILKAIPAADREVLMSNARAFKARQVIVDGNEKAG